jgi:hypothetical protein
MRSIEFDFIHIRSKTFIIQPFPQFSYILFKWGCKIQFYGIHALFAPFQQNCHTLAVTSSRTARFIPPAYSSHGPAVVGVQPHGGGARIPHGAAVRRELQPFERLHVIADLDVRRVPVRSSMISWIIVSLGQRASVGWVSVCAAISCPAYSEAASSAPIHPSTPSRPPFR